MGYFETGGEMNNEYNAEELLIIVLGNIIKCDLGGTTEAAEGLAEKIIYIIDNKRGEK